jgi:hypothetical protein
MKAREIKQGMIIKEGKQYFEVLEIKKITEKAIHFNITRIWPDVYGNFALYKRINTNVDIVDSSLFDMDEIRKNSFYAKNS